MTRQKTAQIPSGPGMNPSCCKLAVIITCWNYEDYVVRAIDSVVSQQRTDCDLIVIDDGSEDGSWEAICSTGVTAYRTKNRGQLQACLLGMEKTDAPFLLFLDADDELEPGSLGTILDHLDSDVAKLQFSLTTIDHEGCEITRNAFAFGQFRCRIPLMEKVLRDGVYATPPTSGNVFRRDLCEFLKQVDYDRAVDGVILFAAPFLGDIVSLEAPLGRYRIHNRNDSGLGQPLDPAILRRDLHRFTERTEHLRRILAGLGLNGSLVSAEKAYFHLERGYYLSIAESRSLAISDLVMLLGALRRQDYALKTKAAIAFFFMMMAVMPKQKARQGLTYRLKSQHRSLPGFLRAIIAPPEQRA